MRFGKNVKRMEGRAVYIPRRLASLITLFLIDGFE